MLASCSVCCASRGGLDKGYIKVDMRERRKTLIVWLKRTRDRGGVEGTRLQAKDTKKISQAKDSTSENRPFLGQGHRRKCSQKIIMSSKIFFMRLKKKVSKKVFQMISKKQSQKLSKTIRSTKNFFTRSEEF